MGDGEAELVKLKLEEYGSIPYDDPLKRSSGEIVLMFGDVGLVVGVEGA